jgi:SAM-dependent methyltransferase
MSRPQLAPADEGGETAAAGERRKLLGQWATPASLVDHLVSVVVATRAGRPVRAVLDPACGDGRFLLAARRAFGASVRLVGIDVDERAVAAARAALPDAAILHADALHGDLGDLDDLGELADHGFDVVIGNPPYLNQLSAATSRGGRSRHGGGPYADTAAEFLALAATLAAPAHGTIALVLPQSILTTRDVGPIRAEVARRGAISHTWWSTSSMFDAHVHVCALVLTLGVAQGPVTRSFGPAFEPRPAVDLGDSWGRLIVDRPDALGAPQHRDGSTSTLGDVATFSVDFRDQFYGLIGAVGDDVDGPPLITSGLIDPGICHWGRRPARFAKQTYAAPRVDVARLSPRLQRWAGQRLVPKLLIANQTRRIEAAIDHDGSWLPSVPVITCMPRPDAMVHLDALLAALSSAETNAWALDRAAGSGLSPTTIRLTPSLLAAAPWPTDVPRTAAS